MILLPFLSFILSHPFSLSVPLSLSVFLSVSLSLPALFFLHVSPLRFVSICWCASLTAKTTPERRPDFDQSALDFWELSTDVTEKETQRPGNRCVPTLRSVTRREIHAMTGQWCVRILYAVLVSLVLCHLISSHLLSSEPSELWGDPVRLGWSPCLCDSVQCEVRCVALCK